MNTTEREILMRYNNIKRIHVKADSSYNDWKSYQSLTNTVFANFTGGKKRMLMYSSASTLLRDIKAGKDTSDLLRTVKDLQGDFKGVAKTIKRALNAYKKSKSLYPKIKDHPLAKDNDIVTWHHNALVTCFQAMSEFLREERKISKFLADIERDIQNGTVQQRNDVGFLKMLTHEYWHSRFFSKAVKPSDIDRHRYRFDSLIKKTR